MRKSSDLSTPRVIVKAATPRPLLDQCTAKTLPLLLGPIHPPPPPPPTHISACTSLPLSILLTTSSDTATSHHSRASNPPALSCHSLALHCSLDSPFPDNWTGQSTHSGAPGQARPTRPDHERTPLDLFLSRLPAPSIIPLPSPWISIPGFSSHSSHPQIFVLPHCPVPKAAVVYVICTRPSILPASWPSFLSPYHSSIDLFSHVGQRQQRTR